MLAPSQLVSLRVAAAFGAGSEAKVLNRQGRKTAPGEFSPNLHQIRGPTAMRVDDIAINRPATAGVSLPEKWPLRMSSHAG